MKIVQTLGRAGGQSEGVFNYKRTSTHVVIDASINANYTQGAKVLFIPNKEWDSLLHGIESAADASFRITADKTGAKQDLHALIDTHVSGTVNDSMKAYIVALLEHEGSIDIDHGAGGPIPLKRSN